MNWKDVETWEEAAKQVADLIKKNEFLEWYVECTNKESLEQVRELMEKNKFLEKRKNFYKEQLRIRSAEDEYYAKLDSGFKEEVYNILYEDPSGHADHETLELIKILAKGEHVRDSLTTNEHDNEAIEDNLYDLPTTN